MGIFSTRKTLGVFCDVMDVDVRYLSGCNVEIIADATKSCVVVAEGRRRLARAIKVACEYGMLVISNGSSEIRNTGSAETGPGGFANTGYRGPLSSRVNVRVRNTGDAISTGDGYANSGIHITGSKERIHVVQPNSLFKHIVVGAAVTVSFSVLPGAEVKYYM